MIMNMNAGNCNYAVELGHQCKFSLVGIDGKDIYDGKDIPKNGQHVPTLGTANWSAAFLCWYRFLLLIIYPVKDDIIAQSWDKN